MSFIFEFVTFYRGYDMGHKQTHEDGLHQASQRNNISRKAEVLKKRG
jgi:hypothetical protein